MICNSNFEHILGLLQSLHLSDSSIIFVGFQPLQSSQRRHQVVQHEAAPVFGRFSESVLPLFLPCPESFQLQIHCSVWKLQFE